MRNKKIAEEFQKFWDKEKLNWPTELANSRFIYDAARIGWQASRESLVIELPELPSVHDGYTKHEIDFMAYAVDTCKDAIECAGIKVVQK